MEDMAGEQLAQLLWGLVSLQLRPPPEWMAAWFAGAGA
jgi:hypothetical protein